jgi:hypothetical protein
MLKDKSKQRSPGLSLLYKKVPSPRVEPYYSLIRWMEKATRVYRMTPAIRKTKEANASASSNQIKGGFPRRQLQPKIAHHAWRRRPDRADRRVGPSLVQNRQGLNAESLSGPAPRHVLNPQGPGQRGSAYILQGVSDP